jgi:hypothetical protein
VDNVRGWSNLQSGRRESQGMPNCADLVGPLASFQAIAFNKTEVRQLLATINNAAKEAALKDQNLDVAFDKWWPDLERKVEAISSAAQPPSEPQRNERDLLEEIVENTRTLIRELQGLPPWQRHPQIESIVRALQRSAEPSPRPEGLLDLLTPKSE